MQCNVSARNGIQVQNLQFRSIIAHFRGFLTPGCQTTFTHRPQNIYAGCVVNTLLIEHEDVSHATV